MVGFPYSYVDTGDHIRQHFGIRGDGRTSLFSVLGLRKEQNPAGTDAPAFCFNFSDVSGGQWTYAPSTLLA